MYKLTNTTSILRLSDNASIPADESNTDYQVYLEWSKSNKPQPIDLPSKAELNVSILEKLDLLDTQKIRAISDAILLADKTKLQALETQAADLRKGLIK